MWLVWLILLVLAQLKWYTVALTADDTVASAPWNTTHARVIVFQVTTACCCRQSCNAQARMP
jgi:hypothetical protein